MKINQLFRKRVDTDLLLDIARCFGLSTLNDRKSFCKQDLFKERTVERLRPLLPTIEDHYLPCKARVYIDELTEKRAITMFKQMLRLHGHYLLSRERNVNNRKIVYYTLMNEMERDVIPKIQHHSVTQVLYFS